MNKKLLLKTWCLGVGMALAMDGLTQDNLDIPLSGGKNVRLVGVKDVSWQQAIMQQQAADAWYWVAHVSQPSRFAEACRANRLSVQSRLFASTYVVKSGSFPLAPDLLAWGLDAVGVLDAGLKTDTSLLSGNIPVHARRTGNRVQVLAEVYPGMPVSDAAALLASAGFTPESTPLQSSGVFQITCARQDLPRLAAFPFISYVQAIPPPEKTLNEVSRSMSRASLLRAPLAAGGRQLSGAGVTVGVGDNADPTLHPDLTDRIINHTPGIVNDHGAHVTGTIAGAGLILPQRTGFAPAARVVNQWFGGIWQNAPDYVQRYNMVLTNNSYANFVGECALNGVYDLYSRLIDQQAQQYPQLLHVFASGNDGEYTCSPFPMHYGTVLSGMQSAKNSITSGRTDYIQQASASSSSGPVRDGRLKPEIVALGEAIQSTKGLFSISNAYFPSWGTSMAAPAITGGLTLLYERYRQLKEGANPNGSLMKAILLNGARDIGNPGPDFRNGYGLMHLENSLRMLESGRYRQQAIAQGAVQDTVIQVPAGTHQLKVMLCWHDPAASVLAAKTLVNDLDLQVVAPGGATVLPLILNASAPSVALAAAPGTDRVNNSEQVVINNPVPGNYTIRVSGYDVMVNSPQPYAVAFDMLQQGIQIQVPFQGDSWTPAAAPIPVSWDYHGTSSNPFTLEYSPDDGSSWTLISNSIASDLRFYQWTPPASLTTTARLRISQNGTGTTFTTGQFSLIGNPNASLAAAADQCEGYIRMNWTAVAGVDQYEVLLKRGPEMVPVAQVDAAVTSYVIGGLKKDSVYYATVRAIKNGVRGRWNTPVERRPNSGGCSGTISDNDLQLDSITNPLSGRQLTSSALSAASNISIRVKNLDNAPAAAFTIKYSINEGPLVSQAITTPLAGGATYTHVFNGIDFSAPGEYRLLAVVTHTAASDPIAVNDTFRTVIRHLTNAPVVLSTPFSDGFENSGEVEVRAFSTLGIGGTQRWDFLTEDTYGRLRTSPFAQAAHSGLRSATLDVSKAPPYAQSGKNNLIGTFNLSGYSAATDDIRLQFWYQHHGITQSVGSQNKVWARGGDTQQWVEIYDLGANQPVLSGQYGQTGSIELAKKLAGAGQSLSASTQIRFGQQSLYSAADATKFGGLTFDDISLKIAVNDVQLLRIDTPLVYSCGLNGTVPVRIRVRNSMQAELRQIPVSYQINGGPVVTETIASLQGNSEMTYTFTQTANLSATADYTLVAAVNMPGDNIPENNQATATIVHQPVVTAFPHIQDFESGNGSWFTGGWNSSWEYGTPASLKIASAASGTKAWKTTLTGAYNDNETSYLYSPCYTISAMTAPTLSFSMAYDIEDCSAYGVVCDGAWMEYSYDGTTWTKLATAGSGTNWYDYGPGQVWMKSNQTHWHVATAALPKQSGSIRLRMVMKGDDGVNREGVAIDDIHIYDMDHQVFAGTASSDSIVQTLSTGNQVKFLHNNQLMAAITLQSGAAGQAGVKTWVSNGAVRYANKGYYSQRNLTIQSNLPAGSPLLAKLRLYITDAEVNQLRQATACGNCRPVADFTSLQLQRYSGAGQEDSSLFNNIGGLFEAIPASAVKRVPYGAGYYFETETSGFSEWWFSNATDLPPVLPVTWVWFRVALQHQQPQLTWQVDNELDVDGYAVEYAFGNSNHFTELVRLPKKPGTANRYTYTDLRPTPEGTLYYRIRQVDKDGSFSYSPVRQVVVQQRGPQVVLFPVPASRNLQVRISDANGLAASLELLDQAGRVLQQRTLAAGLVSGNHTISVESLQEGAYQLKIRLSNGKVVIRPFTVMR